MAKKFITPYSRDVESVRDCSVIEFTEPSQVKESLAYATDINAIYEEFCCTGRVPLNGQQPIYDENFVKYDSLIEAQKIIGQATEYFSGLPAKIKNQYGNSLEKFIYALNAKDEFLVKEGLLQLPTAQIDEKENININEKENVNPSAGSDIPPSTVSPDVNLNTATTD